MLGNIPVSGLSVQWHISIRTSYSGVEKSKILFVIHSGNWGVDLQAGSTYGYKLLFVVLLAGLFAVLLQVCGSHSDLILKLTQNRVWQVDLVASPAMVNFFAKG